jgi:shikimate kinase
MPGSGKSTWGKKLANALKYSFIDLDEMIEKTAGMSIENIFEQKGEEYFREIEHQCLLGTLSFSNVIVSTGGGCPCYFNNLEVIKNNGISVHLLVDIGILASRIMGAKVVRPMFLNLSKAEILAKLDEIFLKRNVFYNQADIVFETRSQTVKTLVNTVREHILIE